MPQPLLFHQQVHEWGRRAKHLAACTYPREVLPFPLH